MIPRLYLSALVAVCFIAVVNPAIVVAQKRIGGHIPTPAGMLCFSTEVFAAEIQSGSLKDCRPKDPSLSTCDPKDELTLRLRVDEMLALNEQELSLLKIKEVQPSDSVDAVARLFNGLPSDADRQFPPADELGALKVTPPTGKALSDQEIPEQFIGKKFIFGIRPNPFDKTHLPFATVWPMKLRGWIEDYLHYEAGSCPRLVRTAKSP